ncbi:MAG: MerR family transcriptional regulator [Leisingera sp.]
MSKSPDAFRTISEVAEWLGVQAHVLRFWESKFTQVKPVKRAGGRRYYRPADMLLLGGIKKLLHDDGLPIKEVQAMLREHGTAHVAEFSHPLENETGEPPAEVPPADKLGDDWQSSLELPLEETAQDAVLADAGDGNVVGFPQQPAETEPQPISETATASAPEEPQMRMDLDQPAAESGADLHQSAAAPPATADGPSSAPAPVEEPPAEAELAPAMAHEELLGEAAPAASESAAAGTDSPAEAADAAAEPASAEDTAAAGHDQPQDIAEAQGAEPQEPVEPVGEQTVAEAFEPADGPASELEAPVTPAAVSAPPMAEVEDTPTVETAAEPVLETETAAEQAFEPAAGLEEPAAEAEAVAEQTTAPVETAQADVAETAEMESDLEAVPPTAEEPQATPLPNQEPVQERDPAEDALVTAAGMQPDVPLEFGTPAGDPPVEVIPETEPAVDAKEEAPPPFPPHDLDEAARQVDALEFASGFRNGEAPAAETGETAETAAEADTAEPEALPETTAGPAPIAPGVLAHLAALRSLPPQSRAGVAACAEELRAWIAGR